MNEDDLNEGERELDCLEAAWADCARALRGGLRLMRDTKAAFKVRTRSLLAVHGDLESYRERFEAGDASALLAALQTALDENVPVPYWVSVEVRARLRRVLSMQSEQPESLHDAFGLGDVVPLTPKRYAAARTDLKREWPLWVEVHRQMRDEGLSLDRALSAAARPLGLSKTKARELYLRREAIQSAADPSKRFRRFGGKREVASSRRS